MVLFENFGVWFVMFWQLDLVVYFFQVVVSFEGVEVGVVVYVGDVVVYGDIVDQCYVVFKYFDI